MRARRTFASTIVAPLVALLSMAILAPSWLVAQEPDAFEAISLRKVPDPCGGFQLTNACESVPAARREFTLLPGGRVEAAGVTPMTLIVRAYRPGGQNASRVIGAPDWVSSDRYDLIALTGREGVETEDADSLERGVASMLRTLLTDRFKLRVHTEPRKASVLTLRRTNTAALGPSLHPAAHACTLPPRLTIVDLALGKVDCVTMTSDMLQVRGLTMSDLARVLEQIDFTKRTVRDETGLQDRYDFVLQSTGSGGYLVGPTGKIYYPRLTGGVLESQLGMALVRTTGLVDHLIIDSIKKPAED